MPLFKGDAFVPDEWWTLAQGEDLPPSGKVILTLAAMARCEASGTIGRYRAWSMCGTGQRPAQTIAPELRHFALIVIAFPKFTDGRGYSLAHQLRGSYGFKGELRATGDILFDQLQLLARCGFDSFDIRDEATLRLLEAGRRPDLGIFYQPGLGP